MDQTARPADRPMNAPVLRTLLICDLADSTAMVEKQGDLRAADVMRRHDRLSRDLMQRHGGREIDKTDGFLLLFDRPVRAVAFALEYQRRLAELGAEQSVSLRARVGIHVGELVLWDNEAGDIAQGAKPIEVEGLVKPVAARLMGVALPGQILMSGIAHTLALRARSELGETADLRWIAHGNYHFKGLLEPVDVYEVGERGVAPFKPPARSSKAYREKPWWRRPGVLALAMLTALLLLTTVVYRSFHDRPAVAFAKRDWVVVGDLANLTGKSVFDDSLQTAFRLGLEESRYVNVLSTLMVSDALQRMQRNPEQTRIDRSIGSEVAIREGARALILPTVAEIGGRVRVTAEVIDPHTQATVYSESADGAGPESLLASVDKVNQLLRVRLGEALNTVSSESQPLEKVVTKNLDALRAYSIGFEAYYHSRQADARELFQKAVELDPQFALAYLGVARTYYSNDDFATAKAYLDKAATLRDRLSPRDALYVDAWVAVFGPSRPMLAKWKALSQLYPDYFSASYQYAFFAWQYENRAADAIAALQPALNDHNPQRSGAYYLLGFLQAANNQFDAALASFEVAVSLGNPHQGTSRAAAYAAQRRFAEADQVLSQAKPSGIATTDILLPRREIVQLLDRGYFERARSSIMDPTVDAAQVGPLYYRAYRAMKLSLDDYAGPSAAHRAAVREFIAEARTASEDSPDANREDAVFATVFGAYLAARAGDSSLAQSTLAHTASQTRNSGRTNLEHLQTIAEAEVAWRAGRTQEAIARLEPGLDGTELYLTHVALADAYSAAGRNDDAVREAQWLASHRGRAYLETNSLQMLQARNVAESDIAVLRLAELEHALEHDAEAQKQLAAFDAIWPRAAQPMPVAARAERLTQGFGGSRNTSPTSMPPNAQPDKNPLRNSRLSRSDSFEANSSGRWHP